MQSVAVEILTDLGLNQLEAEVYTLLLTHEPSTAYRVAKLLGKPTANVYKAVESLARRGAVMMEEGDNRLCRAVPADEFLRHYRESFAEKVQQAAHSLRQLRAAVPDERVYQLESSPLVLERCRGMLERCRKIAVLDAFPRPLQALLPAVSAAIERGVQLFVQVYEPTHIEGAQVALTHQGKEVLQNWKSQQLNLVIDGQELVLALLSHNLREVYQGVWSESLYLSNILHAGMMREQVVHRLMEVQGQENALEAMRGILAGQQFFHNSDVPGQQALLARFS